LFTLLLSFSPSPITLSLPLILGRALCIEVEAQVHSPWLPREEIDLRTIDSMVSIAPTSNLRFRRSRADDLHGLHLKLRDSIGSISEAIQDPDVRLYIRKPSRLARWCRTLTDLLLKAKTNKTDQSGVSWDFKDDDLRLTSDFVDIAVAEACVFGSAATRLVSGRHGSPAWVSTYNTQAMQSRRIAALLNKVFIYFIRSYD
tara:strand:- start:51 stop:653 length:603 start_codon:yes stop_codon:yes gene_type:complete